MSDQKGNIFEISNRHIRGGMRETVETGEYPDYYQIKSRKYKKIWKVKELPASLKFKGETVYTVEDEFRVYDWEGNALEDVEFSLEMRD